MCDCNKKESHFSFKRVLKIFIVFVFVLTLVIGSLFVYRRVTVNARKREIGKQLVLALYDFYSPEQLNEQMRVVKLLTTEAVFNQLTIDNEERTLNTYLKFKNKPVTVNVIKNTEDYVLYSLSTESISGERVFLFMFNLDNDGKVNWVREEECIDFY